jgi:NAD(P)-dependent dehydrogenase (short-subunit alcohol dehydrogenase family)
MTYSTNPTSVKHTVLVLGAYGEAGAAITRGLCAAARFNVVGAGRNADRLAGLERSVEGLTTCQLDITHDEALRDAMASAGLVINCVGPYIGTGAQVAQAALDAGIPYLDIASEQEHYRRVRAMSVECMETGGLILTGAGAYPGLSGLLLKAMIQRHPNARGVEMALISGPHADPAAGAAQSLSAVIELAYEHTALSMGQHRVIPAGEHREFVFPQPFGPRDVLTWPQMEILAMAESGGLSDISTFVALAGERLPPWWLLRFLRLIHPMPGSFSLALVRRALAALHARRTTVEADPTTNRGAMVVSLDTPSGTHVAEVLVSDLEAATAWLPVYAATQWADGALTHRGVAVAMDVFDSEEVLRALQEATPGLFKLTGI